MSHFINANPLNYDAQYPKNVDTSVNEEARIKVMEMNIGKDILHKGQNDKTYGKIVGVYDGQRYLVNLNGISETIIVGELDINFVEDIGTKI